MSQPSASSVVFSAQLQLFCAQARVAWGRAEELEIERKKLENQLRDVRHERLWASTVAQRLRIDTNVVELEARLAALAPRLHTARDAALVASERAAYYGWGVKLGRQYRITRDGISSVVLVQNFRPLPTAHQGGRILASGEAGGRPSMFVLGRDDLFIEPLGSEKVIDITARLQARGAKPR